jgi:hypothetical protein
MLSNSEPFNGDGSTSLKADQGSRKSNFEFLNKALLCKGKCLWTEFIMQCKQMIYRLVDKYMRQPRVLSSGLRFSKEIIGGQKVRTMPHSSTCLKPNCETAIGYNAKLASLSFDIFNFFKILLLRDFLDKEEMRSVYIGLSRIKQFAS